MGFVNTTWHRMEKWRRQICLLQVFKGLKIFSLPRVKVNNNNNNYFHEKFVTMNQAKFLHKRYSYMLEFLDLLNGTLISPGNGVVRPSKHDISTILRNIDLPNSYRLLIIIVVQPTESCDNLQKFRTTNLVPHPLVYIRLKS